MFLTKVQKGKKKIEKLLNQNTSDPAYLVTYMEKGGKSDFLFSSLFTCIYHECDKLFVHQKRSLNTFVYFQNKLTRYLKRSHYGGN